MKENSKKVLNMGQESLKNTMELYMKGNGMKISGKAKEN